MTRSLIYYRLYEIAIWGSGGCILTKLGDRGAQPPYPHFRGLRAIPTPIICGPRVPPTPIIRNPRVTPYQGCIRYQYIQYKVVDTDTTTCLDTGIERADIMDFGYRGIGLFFDTTYKNLFKKIRAINITKLINFFILYL